MPRSILEHPRSCLSADIQVRAWEKELALAESLHLLVELFSTDGGEETEADEPYKTVAEWQKEGWDTSFLDVDEVCTQVNLMTTNQQQKSLKTSGSISLTPDSQLDGTKKKQTIKSGLKAQRRSNQPDVPDPDDMVIGDDVTIEPRRAAL